MYLNHLMDQIDKIKSVITKVRAHGDFIQTAVNRGTLDPKTDAICLTSEESWEERSWLYSDLQTEVDSLSHILVEVVLPVQRETLVGVSLDAMRALKAIGVTVVIDVDIEREAMPINVYGVFEIDRRTKFSF